VLVTIIIAFLFPISRLLCQIFSYDFPKIRNLSKIFPKKFRECGPRWCRFINRRWRKKQ